MLKTKWVSAKDTEFLRDPCPIEGESGRRIEVGDQIVQCPECNSWYHLDCWEMAGNKCSVLGCNGQGEPGPSQSDENVIYVPSSGNFDDLDIKILSEDSSPVPFVQPSFNYPQTNESPFTLEFDDHDPKPMAQVLSGIQTFWSRLSCGKCLGYLIIGLFVFLCLLSLFGQN